MSAWKRGFSFKSRNCGIVRMNSSANVTLCQRIAANLLLMYLASDCPKTFVVTVSSSKFKMCSKSEAVDAVFRLGAVPDESYKPPLPWSMLKCCFVKVGTWILTTLAHISRIKLLKRVSTVTSRSETDPYLRQWIRSYKKCTRYLSTKSDSCLSTFCFSCVNGNCSRGSVTWLGTFFCANSISVSIFMALPRKKWTQG